jgi:hypothetical protein
MHGHTTTMHNSINHESKIAEKSTVKSSKVEDCSQGQENRLNNVTAALKQSKQRVNQQKEDNNKGVVVSTQVYLPVEKESLKAKEVASLSSISGNTPLTTNNASSSIQCISSSIQCTMKWNQFHQDKVVEERQNKKRIYCFVKDHLFKKVKFITCSQTAMLFSLQKHSICQRVCNGLNINAEDQQNYWSLYSRLVEKAIGSARNDAVAAVRNAFKKGKLQMSSSC